jgi:hypothetical protein
MQSYEATLDGKTIKYRAGTTIEEFLAETSSRLSASATPTQILPLCCSFWLEWRFTKCARRIALVFAGSEQTSGTFTRPAPCAQGTKTMRSARAAPCIGPITPISLHRVCG